MIIGVSGFARGGKDTAGAYLCEAYGYRKDRFAAGLKRIAADVFGWGPEHIDGELKETPDERYPLPGRCPDCGGTCVPTMDGGEWWCTSCARRFPRHLTSRVAQQTIGETMRRLYEDVWVEATLRPIEPHARVVLCDVRFPNEALAIRRRGGRVIRLLRGKPQSEHVSETALIDRHDCYDVAIDNSAYTLGELYESIDRCMRQWGIEAAA